MGVRGLTTFIACSNELYLKEYILHDCNLVIDGHSLAAQIYKSADCNSAFGGDYDKYARLVKKVFQNLKKCNVSPFVIFDGSHERRKFRTLFSRHRSKVEGASWLYPGNQSELQIFPLLFRDTFKEVLVEMNIQFTVCEFEADEEIAALARFLQCPVMSYDSDFYIFNVLYIPYPTLHSTPKKITNGVKGYGLECRIYKVEYFLNQFGGLKQDMLPLFAALLGNDYIQKKVFNNFFNHLKLPKSKRLRNEQQRSIRGLLEWLRNESLDSAIRKVIGRLKRERKVKVLKILQSINDSYNTVYCKSLKYFQLESIPVNQLQDSINIKEQYNKEMEQNENSEDEENDTSSTTSADSQDMCDDKESEDNGEILPEWVVRGIRGGQLVQPYINLCTYALYVGSPQAEDYDSEDASLCAVKILRYSFDLLTDFSEHEFTYLGRVGKYSKKISITASDSLKIDNKCVEKIPFIDGKGEIIDYFNLFLTKTMPAINLDLVRTLPDNCQIFMLALIWWVKETSPSMAHVYSIFLMYVMLDVIDDKIGNFRGHFFFNKKHSVKLEQLKNSAKPVPEDNGNEQMTFLNKNKVLYEHCLIAASRLLENFDMDDAIKKRPRIYDLCRVHSFAQFQCCLQQFSYLNLLTGCSFPPVIFHKVYNGTFAYNIFNRLRIREDPLLYIATYLQGGESVISIFKSICHVYSTIVETLNIIISPNTGKKSNRGRKNKKNKKIVGDVLKVECNTEIECNPELSENEFLDENNKFNILFSSVHLL